MSRPIAYNKPGAAINGSITNEDAVISYVVDGRGNDYYNNYESCVWVPSADGAAPIVFVTDTFTRGYEGDPNLAVPLFFACAGTSSAAILYTANRLPGSPGNYTNANTALDELNRTYGYFILESNDPFEGTNATNLRFEVDASKMISYPQTGTNWYDLSGNGSTGTLQNGVLFSSSGWFNFDGTNDQVATSINRGQLGVAMSVEATFRYTGNSGDAYRPIIGGNDPGVGTEFFLGKNSGNNYFGVQDGNYDGGFVTGYDVFDGRWHHMVYTYNNNTGILYLDGTLRNSGYFSGCNAGEQIYIGAEVQEGYWWKGDISQAKYYTQTLSEAGVKQNYFGAPIVTDGLVFAVDANNIVSYPKSGTAWYNLTGSVPSASLFNSPIFTLPNGGAIDFDGTDDFASTPSTTISGDQTLCAWGVAEGPPNSPAGVITQHDFVSTANFGINYVQNSGYRFGASIGYTNGTREYDSKVTNYTVQEGVIWNVVLVYSSSNNTIYWYVNGQLDSTYALSATPKSTNWPIGLGRWDPSYPAYYFTGKIFNSKIYNRALSASEVQQNYQAEQYRFAGPQGIVTNGLTLWLDAGNLDSYPGTGTTWYDLSGNNNNGALKSAAQWSNLGWMNYDGNNTDTETTVATVEINTNSAQGNTVEQWIYGAALNENGNMPFTWLDYDFDLWWYSNLFGINNGNSLVYGISGANSILLNNWVHVVAYFPYDWAGSYTNAKFWINGVAQSMSIVLGGLVNKTLPSSLNVGIGGGYTGGGDAFNWNGRISQTRIYTRELTTAEVQQNYNATKAKFGL
jgi:hypothetical protein